MHRAIVGLDVGSTTVKAVIVDPETKEIVWSDYQRHHTKQAECVLDFMVRMGQVFQGYAAQVAHSLATRKFTSAA